MPPAPTPRRATRASAATSGSDEGGGGGSGGGHTARATVLEALGAGMAVLMLLDVVRVGLGTDLRVALQRPCKVDPALTCAPFNGGVC